MQKCKHGVKDADAAESAATYAPLFRGTSCVHFAFCILNFALLGCTASPPPTPPGAIVVGVRTGPNNIDPRLGNDEASGRIAQLMFNQLFDTGDDLRPKPMLAERLEPLAGREIAPATTERSAWK